MLGGRVNWSTSKSQWAAPIGGCSLKVPVHMSRELSQIFIKTGHFMEQFWGVFEFSGIELFGFEFSGFSEFSEVS